MDVFWSSSGGGFELSEESIYFHDFEVPVSNFESDVLEGLQQTPKVLEPKYFYNEQGSDLFNQICETDEYYVTRTEMDILKNYQDDISEKVGPESFLIEYGSGASHKARVLLDSFEDPAGIMSIDISKEELIKATSQLASDYDDLNVVAVCADYSQTLEVDRMEGFAGEKKVAFFPGSTIGNLHPEQAGEFLKGVAQTLDHEGDLIIGVDLKKDPAILEAAYNDPQGITADFKQNHLGSD